MVYDGRVEAQIRVPSGKTVAATNGAGSTKQIPLPANNYYLTDLLALLQSQLNTYSDSTGWVLSLSTGSTGTGQVTITCPGTWSLGFTSIELRQLLGFSFDIAGASSAQISQSQARSLWIPDCPIAMDQDPTIAPLKSDLRATQSPTGTVLGLVGNFRYVHANVRWSHVPLNRIWTAKEVLANQSWQTFVKDTQWSVGANELALWFRPQSPCQLYGLNGIKVGTNLLNGWSLIGVESISPPLSAGTAPRVAFYNVTIPQIVSIGGP